MKMNLYQITSFYLIGDFGNMSREIIYGSVFFYPS